MAKITDPDLYSNININYSNKTININNNEDQKDLIRSDVFIENRNRQIDSLLNNKPYKEMRLEDHKHYDHIFNPVTITQLYEYVQSILRNGMMR